MGLAVAGDRVRFPALPEGEYYWFQVLGLPVINVADGALLGYLEEIIPTPAHDVYVVRAGDAGSAVARGGGRDHRDQPGGRGAQGLASRRSFVTFVIFVREKATGFAFEKLLEADAD